MPDLEWYNHEQQLFHNERFNPLQNMTCKHIWSTLFQNLVSWLHRQNCKALQACFWSKGALIMLKCLFWKHENQIAEKENALQWNADCKNNSSETCKYFSDRLSYIKHFIVNKTQYIVSQVSKWIWIMKHRFASRFADWLFQTSYDVVQLTLNI